MREKAVPGTRQRLAVLAAALVAVVVAAVWSPVASAAPTGLVVSNSSNRSNPVTLAGASLNGNRYIFVTGYSQARRVLFTLDTLPSVTRSSPFDYAGTAGNGQAMPLDTTALADGDHTLTARVTGRNGALIATFDRVHFTVANQQSPSTPVVSAITPSTGPSTGGTAVTITGTNLTGGSVAFGANTATGVSCTAGSCTATSPAGSGTVDVTVTAAGVRSATGAADQFTYQQPQPSGAYWTPAPLTTWQWQLTQPVDTTVDAAVYDVDGFDTPASTVASLHAQGRKVICYLSVGSWENWRPDAASFPAAVKGSSNGWPGEKWLDIRRIDLLAPVMTARFTMCRDKGFDAVEPDNVDGYTNSTGFPLSASDQSAYNRWVADTVHSLGLSVGLKNDVDQVPSLQPSFDWALNEQCNQYGECGGYQSFVSAGKAVFVTEYQGNLAALCPGAVASGYSLIMKRLSLDAWRQTC